MIQNILDMRYKLGWYFFGGGGAVVMFIEVVKLKCTVTTSHIKGPRLSSKHRSRTCWLVSLVDSRLESVELLHHSLISKASPSSRIVMGMLAEFPMSHLATSGLRQSSLSPCNLAKVTWK